MVDCVCPKIYPFFSVSSNLLVNSCLWLFLIILYMSEVAIFIFLFLYLIFWTHTVSLIFFARYASVESILLMFLKEPALWFINLAFYSSDLYFLIFSIILSNFGILFLFCLCFLAALSRGFVKPSHNFRHLILKVTPEWERVLLLWYPVYKRETRNRVSTNVFRFTLLVWLRPRQSGCVHKTPNQHCTVSLINFHNFANISCENFILPFPLL